MTDALKEFNGSPEAKLEAKIMVQTWRKIRADIAQKRQNLTEGVAQTAAGIATELLRVAEIDLKEVTVGEAERAQFEKDFFEWSQGGNRA